MMTDHEKCCQQEALLNNNAFRQSHLSPENQICFRFFRRRVLVMPSAHFTNPNKLNICFVSQKFSYIYSREILIYGGQN